MAEKSESLLEKIADKIHSRDESSSSDSDDEKRKPSSDSSSEPKIYRLFGREKPLHQVLGGGKQADLFLWRDKKSSAAVLGSTTAIWVLFELMEYHFITLVCYALILMLAILFVWFNAATFLNKSRPHIPEIEIPEDPAIDIVRSLIFEINRLLAALKEIALGRDYKNFFAVIAGLWVLSIVGSFFSLLTLSFIVFVLLHTVPLVYAKHEDTIDSFGEKAMAEIQKQYAVVEAAVLSKIPRKNKSH